MKKKGLFLIVIALAISCTSKKNTVEISNKDQVNYIPYYLKVEEAKKLYNKKENIKSFQLLDSLFKEYKPINTLFIDELEIYAELAFTFNKKDRLDEIIDILISDYGYDVADYEGKLWEDMRKNSKLPRNVLKNRYLTFQNSLNTVLRDSIIDLFKKDQAIRKTNDSKKIDSLDRKQEPYLIRLIKTYGYPNFKMIGGNGIDEVASPAHMIVMLKHISLNGALELEPILLEEVKKGNCPRDAYAGMLDVHIAVLKEKTPFCYLGTYSNFMPTDTSATNKARAKIGLPRIKF